MIGGVRIAEAGLARKWMTSTQTAPKLAAWLPPPAGRFPAVQIVNVLSREVAQEEKRRDASLVIGD
jgi:hypothetical protein